MSQVARRAVFAGAALALLGCSFLPAHPMAGVALIDFGLGMCAAVLVVWVDARRWAR